MNINGYPELTTPDGTEYVAIQESGIGSVSGRKLRVSLNNITSSIDTQLAAIDLSTSTTTLSGLSGATVTATDLVPAGAFLIGVTTKVLVTITTATGYTVGDGVDADMYGVAATVTAGTTTDNTDATVDPTKFTTAAADVVITATGGSFDGTGDLQVTAHYLSITAP